MGAKAVAVERNILQCTVISVQEGPSMAIKIVKRIANLAVDENIRSAGGLTESAGIPVTR